MARKEVFLTIEREGRDKGKTFKIREMSAAQGESWASRLLIYLAKGNVEVPEGFFNMGWEALAVLGIKGLGGLPWPETQELLREMMGCMQICPDPNRANFSRPLVDDDIEEVSTRLILREAWVELHLGFSIRAKVSSSIAASATPSPSGQNIETFPERLAR